MAEIDHAPDFPTRQALEDQLTKLIDGQLTREQVSDWAWQWINLDPPDDYDDVDWVTLTALMMADTPTTDRPYLFGNVDFEAWLKQLQATDLL